MLKEIDHIDPEDHVIVDANPGRKQVLEVKNIDVNQTITGFQKMLGRFIGEDIWFSFGDQNPIHIRIHRH
ncbi:MAG: hypothetical protein ACLFQY_21240, partial [Desulfococcaceae bacterium]